jgi:TolB-like protein/Tfp pilus assembly protein PilF
MPSLRQLIREIHRRSLWQVLGIYAIASWVIYQIVLAMWEGLGLPEWVPGTALVLLLIGLPIVLATAFIQEGGPGSDRAGDALSADPESHAASGDWGAPDGIAQKAFTWRVALSAGLAAFALLGLGAVGAMLLTNGTRAGAEDGPGVIAVLPFKNMSPDPEDAYFTDGVHEEILAELAGIGELRVISRTSVMEYRDRTRNLTEIAADLGARYVLEGSVRRFADRVRITAQLIDAASDEHLWAETYERERTDLFEIQARVAERIAGTLAARLSPTEQARIAAVPTRDPEAHDLYLRANDALLKGYTSNFDGQARLWQRALALYDEAMGRDPTFAEAAGAAAAQRCRMSWYGHDIGRQNERLAREALDRALQAGSSPGVDVAEGLYWYWCRRDYDRALMALRRAGPATPAFTALSAGGIQAFVLRRQGRFHEALEQIREVAALDPRNDNILQNGAWLAAHVGEYALAREWLGRAIELAPEDHRGYQYLARTVLFETGDPARAWEVLERYPARTLDLLEPRVTYRLFAGDLEAAMALLDAFPDSTTLPGQDELWTVGLMKAFVHRRAGDSARAATLFQDARDQLNAAMAAATDRQDRVATTLALAEAALGLRREAVARSRSAAEALPPSLDAWAAYHYQENLVWTFVLLGDHDAAIHELEFLLGSPRHPPATMLAVDFRWDPLRDDPRFQALLRD